MGIFSKIKGFLGGEAPVPDPTPAWLEDNRNRVNEAMYVVLNAEFPEAFRKGPPFISHVVRTMGDEMHYIVADAQGKVLFELAQDRVPEAPVYILRYDRVVLPTKEKHHA